ncbi:hypothetical protein INS49_011019 [Diaporthe citri]|uniref:uncharacterized protein n=1 Tax=Diaporthe citri TaxID=83186 RepID=UPI001C827A5D|nr:uncharacterized protein INS49_011019 [Diaporthe citri]KAG6359965.1 hypothetical protein INS49_011019 [Diaporthe citri]
MRLSLDRMGRNRPDYARGATLYCRRHLIERARKYYVREAVTNYIQLRHWIENMYKVELDDFGNEARRRGKFEPNRPFVTRLSGAPRAERPIRGSLQRLAVERLAFARLTNSRRFIRTLMRERKLLSHRLVRMETSLQELGFDEQWDGLRKALQAAMIHGVNEIRAHQREVGLGAEAYAIKSINQRRNMREMRSDKSSSSDVEKNDATRGKLVCAVCHPEAQAQQSSRPWAPRWWIAMLRSLYQSRADIGTVDRALINDAEARLCVVRGIVMVVIFRDGERPHFLVLDMELLKGFGSRVITRSKPKVKPSTGLRAKTEKQARASLKRKRQQQNDGNEHEFPKRRRGSSLSLG